MKINQLHSWSVNYQEGIFIQDELQRALILDEGMMTKSMQSIAGADISYEKKSDLFYAAVILMNYPNMDIVEERFAIEKITFPYIPGLLSFREGPALLKVFQKLQNVPDVVMFDGQGIAHPRGIGLASHMGLFLDLPTIGCAKTRLVGCHDRVGDKRGDFADLLLNDRVIGTVLRTKEKVKPLFISPGHKIGIRRAREVALSCCRGYRLPEPVRMAHLYVNRIRCEERGK